MKRAGMKMTGMNCLIMILSAAACLADSLSVRVLDRTTHRETNRISFGSLPYETGYALPAEYLKVIYTNTEMADWVIQISTCNLLSTCPNGLHGGLIGTSRRDVRQPLLWQVFTNTNSQVACTNPAGWAPVKDRRDTDWSSALRDRLVVTNGLLAGFPFPGRQSRSPLSLYLGGCFSNKTPDDYETTVYIEMISLSSYAVPPGIHVQAPSEINLVGDKIVIYADVSDSDIISRIDFNYKKKTESVFTRITENPGSAFYRFRAEIPAAKVTTEGLDYYMEAVDEQANTTNTKTNAILVNPSVTKSIGSPGGDIALLDGNPEDGDVLLTLPAHSLEGSKSITFRQIWKTGEIPAGKSEGAGEGPLMVFEISPYMKLSRLSRLDLLYLDLNNNGLVELTDGTETAVNEKDLALFWWDNFEWRYLGGAVDTVQNTVSSYITHFGVFGLFPATGLTREAFRPKERIITPNNDGINDVLYFGGMNGSVSIEIFNAAGRLVRSISDVCEWDGKDGRGRVVESGVYIYQARFRLNGREEMISGSTAIAR